MTARPRTPKLNAFTSASAEIDKEKQPRPIDIYVGARLRGARELSNMSQDQIAGQFGITFQQIRKYECGANRISASRLYEITIVLNIECVQFFFDNMPTHFDQWEIDLARTHCQGSEFIHNLIRDRLDIKGPKWDEILDAMVPQIMSGEENLTDIGNIIRNITKFREKQERDPHPDTAAVSMLLSPMLR